MKQLVLIFFISWNTNVHSQIMFQKLFGGASQDVSYSVSQTKDSGYVFSGFTQSFGSPNDDIYVIKTNKFGDTLWTRVISGPNIDDGGGIRETSSGNFILTGATNSFGNNEQVYLAKLSSTGNLLWNRTYGIPGIDGGSLAVETKDGGYIITGQNMYPDMYLIKTDAIGNMKWANTIGGVDNDSGNSIQELTDKGFIIVGSTKSFGAGKFDVFLTRTDSLGNVIWSKAYGGPEDDRGNSIHQTKDGGFVIIGTTYSFSFGGFTTDAYLLKTDGSGNLQWSQVFGSFNNYDYGSGGGQTDDKGYYIGGYTQDFGAGGNDAYLIRTDSMGNYLWSKTYGSIGADASYSIQKTYDKGFILSGLTTSFGAMGGLDIYLVKTDSLGNSGCYDMAAPTLTFANVTQVTVLAPLTATDGIVGTPSPILKRGAIKIDVCTSVGIEKLRTSDYSFNVYPNPFTNKIVFDCDIYLSNAELIVYDVFGRVMEKREKIFGKKIIFDRNTLESGIYFYKILIKNIIVSSGKIVAE